MNQGAEKFPKSLLQATRYFQDPDVCVDFVAAMRWPQGVTCPHCEGKKVSYLSSRRIWKYMAKECHKQFSVKTQSVFEDSPIPLDKWLVAVWLVVNCKNGISSYEIARDLKVTQKSAWFMLYRIRLALRDCNWNKLGGSDGGPVEVDETYIGPDPQKMHKKRRATVQAKDMARGGYVGKTAVFGALDRDLRKVRATVVPNVEGETLQREILNPIESGSTIYTDQATVYDRLGSGFFVHKYGEPYERVR
jgi:transposase-like protein